MLQQIRIVLVNTSHPGNIGSCARAMKTMGLNDLYLVNPAQFPHEKATELASGANDVLANASVKNNLEAAITDCHLVVGASARLRAIPWPLLKPKELAQTIQQEAAQSKIAILFGNEQSGLSNEELQRCHLHVTIPSNPEFGSLNIAAAVQVIAYEIYQLAQQENTTEWDYPLASIDEMEKFFEHLQKVLVQIEFLKLSAPRRLMTRLRRLFLRTRMDTMEVNMLRGMLTAIEENK